MSFDTERSLAQHRLRCSLAGEETRAVQPSRATTTATASAGEAPAAALSRKRPRADEEEDEMVGAGDGVVAPITTRVVAKRRRVQGRQGKKVKENVEEEQEEEEEEEEEQEDEEREQEEQDNKAHPSAPAAAAWIPIAEVPFVNREQETCEIAELLLTNAHTAGKATFSNREKPMFGSGKVCSPPPNQQN
jgi:hypothetical protein